MKTLKYFLVLAIILMAGCSKDIGEMENPVELKRAKVPIPFIANCNAINDPGNEYRLIVGGNATHIGKIDADKSFYQFTKITPILIDGVVQYLELEGFGKLIGANGDGFDVTFNSLQSRDYSFEGTADITEGSGTGKFKGCTGSFKTKGGLDGDILLFTVIGTLEYK
jgi:hypothetical protein